MTDKKNIVTVLLLFSFLGLYAQEPFDAQRVNVHFSKTPLIEILEHFSNNYDLNFSYGNDHIKLKEKLSFHSEGLLLNATLKRFFEENNILCAFIGNQLVLRSDDKKIKKHLARKKRKKKRAKKRKIREQKTLERGTLFDFDIHSELIVNTLKLEPEIIKQSVPLSTVEIEPLVIKKVGDAVHYEDPLITDNCLNIPINTETISPHFGQASILPFISTNGRHFNKTNNLSFNLLWGINGGLKGIELGLIGNSIKQKIRGVQIGGFFNTVNAAVYGTQISGLLNICKKELRGIQIAGLWNLGTNIYGTQISGLANIGKDLYGMQISGLNNIATDVYGFQVAGLLNFANGKLFGTQIAGFGNVAWGGKSAVQIAGVFNISAKAQFQASAVFNVAHEVEGVQAGSVNIAKKVNGVQLGIFNSANELKGVQAGLLNSAEKATGLMIGIINVADSIKGVPIGLINIIKNGYNRLELSGGDAMYLNFGAKFGAKKFYHILQGGWAVNSNNIYSWSIGLGLGTTAEISKGLHVNFELLSSHINEDDIWTKELNLLNQFKVTLDIKISDRASLFLGPVYNLILSSKYNEKTKTLGSHIMPYHFFNKTNEGTNIKMWIGATAGLRF